MIKITKSKEIFRQSQLKKNQKKNVLAKRRKKEREALNLILDIMIYEFKRLLNYFVNFHKEHITFLY